MSDKFIEGSSSIKSLKAYIPIRDSVSNLQNITLGLNTSAILLTDPKLFLFTMSKYKFALKMIGGQRKILEIGCMEGAGTLLLSSLGASVTAVDFYRPHIKEAILHIQPLLKNVEFIAMDFLDSPYKNSFNGVVSFDVLEHIDPLHTDLFLGKVYDALENGGVAIIGMPSLESQIYASEINKNAHINCMDVEHAKICMGKFFKSIFVFSMNDEIIHTGYHKMSHYNIYLCIK
jgi:2-polyprenyl-3-methyl-5-hydroxy-6-metoxy-1,4-benzoquinol methylase